jgi:cytochrome d ubiquinol oxidase subunit I
MLLASVFSSAFMVAGISAWYLMRNRHVEFGRVGFSIAMGVITITIPIQLWVGDTLYGKMSVYQPAKTQALEGFWYDTPSAPYLIYINPDSKNQRNKTQIGIPYLGSVLVTHSIHGIVPGLRRTPQDDQPNIGMTFYFFRIMFFLAIMMFFVALSSIALRFTGKLYTTKWFLKLCLWLTPAGVIATVAGWVTSETGRQPYVIYGKLRTIDAASNITSGVVIFSFFAFVVVYLILLGAYIIHIVRIVKKGPEDSHHTLRADGKHKMEFTAGLPQSLKTN